MKTNTPTSALTSKLGTARKADARDYALMLNWTQGRAQGESVTGRNHKRGNHVQQSDALHALTK